MGQPFLVPECVLLRDDAAVGVAEQREAVDPNVPRQLVQVRDPLLVRVGRPVLGATRATRVVQEQPVLVLQSAVVPEVVAAVAEAGAAVQDDHRGSVLVSVRLVVQAGAVDGCFHAVRRA